jgi:hypothetical protein
VFLILYFYERWFEKRIKGWLNRKWKIWGNKTCDADDAWYRWKNSDWLH